MLLDLQAGRRCESWHHLEDLVPYVWTGHNNAQTGMRRTARSWHNVGKKNKGKSIDYFHYFTDCIHLSRAPYVELHLPGP